MLRIMGLPASGTRNGRSLTSAKGLEMDSFTRRQALVVGSGLAALATASMAATRAEMNSIDDPDIFTHKFATVNGIRMHFIEEGQGPLVILLHGYPFLWYLWRHQIRALAAAGYRVVAADQRGYGQTDCPRDINAYNMTHLAGDVVGLMKALGAESAVLVGQDWGSPVVYNATLMRPDLVRGVIMMCSPPAARGMAPPVGAMERISKDSGIIFYQSYLAQPEAAIEIMRDLRRFLLGVFYSTSGYCPADKQWRWAWKPPETFSDTYTLPSTLPPYLSQMALDYYVSEFTRTGIQPANNWYAAIDNGWENTSFLDGAIVRQPALFIGGESDPSLKPQFGIDRQKQGFESLKANFVDMREIVILPGVGHTPPEEKPEEVNAIIINFLKSLRV